MCEKRQEETARSSIQGTRLSGDNIAMPSGQLILICTPTLCVKGSLPARHVLILITIRHRRNGASSARGSHVLCGIDIHCRQHGRSCWGGPHQATWSANVGPSRTVTGLCSTSQGDCSKELRSHFQINRRAPAIGWCLVLCRDERFVEVDNS